MTAALVPSALFLALGFAAGLAYFAALWGNLRLYLAGRKAAAAVLALRLAAVVALFWLIAQFGAASLIASLIGFTLARLPVLSRAGRRP
jgi:F1F0 ATPase subunit 2